MHIIHEPDYLLNGQLHYYCCPGANIKGDGVGFFKTAPNNTSMDSDTVGRAKGVSFPP
jgi:hypothetical protein